MHAKNNHRTNKNSFQVDKATATHNPETGGTKMIEIGRLCVKIAGRDAGKKCIIIDILEGPYVLIDGETRRRKCNAAHLEPLEEKIEINKGASHEEVKNALKKLNIEARETKAKKKTIRPRTLRRSKLAKTQKTETKPAKEEKKPAERKTRKKAVQKETEE